MIFQHTIGLVLSGRKIATTRIWKDDYRSLSKGDAIYMIRSRKNNRRLYYIGQRHSIQPGRGKKGIATLEIKSMSKIMIHQVIEDDNFIYSEGYDNKAEFLSVWQKMHGKKQMGLHIKFKVINLN